MGRTAFMIVLLSLALFAGMLLSADELSRSQQEEATFCAATLTLAMHTSLDYRESRQAAFDLAKAGIDRISEVRKVNPTCYYLLSDGKWYRAVFSEYRSLVFLRDIESGELLYTIYL